MNTNNIISQYKAAARSKGVTSVDALIYAIARAYKYAESEGEASYLATRQMFNAFRPVTNRKKLANNLNGNPFRNLLLDLKRLARSVPEKWKSVMDEEDQAKVRDMAQRLTDAPSRHYLYIFVRQDICPEQQAVQAAHATFVAGAKLRAEQLNADTRASGTFDPTKTHFVLIGVPDLYALQAARLEAQAWGVRTYEFYESDLNDEMTAFTTNLVGQADRYKFREYKLLKMGAQS